MKRKNRSLVAVSGTLVAGALMLAGCSAVSTTGSATAGAAGVPTAQTVLAANENATTVNDDEWSTGTVTAIALEGSSASSDGDGVTIDGNTVTITAAGTYELGGSLDGQVVVDAPEDAVVALVLNGVNISSSSSAAISVVEADDVVVSLSGDNALSDTSSYAEDADVNAALYSTADLTITGDGSLAVTGNGNDGITSTDDLVILSGTITVDAVDDGLRGKDSLTVEGGTIEVTAGGDGLKSDNEDDDARGYIDVEGGTIAVTAGDDAMQAQTDLVITGGTIEAAAEDDALTSETVLVIEGGEVTVTKSYEGIESATMALSGGTIDVTSSDDGINGSGNATSSGDQAGGMQGGGGMQDTGEMIYVTGGTVTVNAGGDGLDSNGSAVVSGGTLTVWGPTANDNGALDVNGSLTVTGGTVLAVGSSGMAVAPDADSSQHWISSSLDRAYAAGAAVRVTAADGTVVAEFDSVKSFQSVVFSSADIVNGAEYTVTVDGTDVATVTADTAAAGGGGGGGGGGMGGGPGSGPGR